MARKELQASKSMCPVETATSATPLSVTLGWAPKDNIDISIVVNGNCF